MGTYKKWVIFSLIWTTVMSVFMGVLWPWYNGDAITVRSIIATTVAYAAGGFVFGSLMYLAEKRRLKKQQA